MIKKIIALVMLFASIFLTSCAQGAASGGAAKTVRLGIGRTDGQAAMFALIMQDKRLLETHLPDDVNVEWSIIPSGADQRDALVAGQLDVGVIGTPILIAAIENDLPLLPLTNSNILPVFLYTNKNHPVSLEELKPDDRMVSAASLGNAAHLALMAYCLEHYGDANYFSNIVGMSFPDVLASMNTSDEFVAVVTSYLFGQEAQTEQVLMEILDLTPYSAEYSLGGCWTVSRKFYDENPAYIDAIYKAINGAVDLILNQPKEAATILNKYWTAYSVEEIMLILANAPPTLEISEKGYDKLAGFMFDIGMLKNPPKKFSEMPNYDSIPKIA